MNYIIPKRQDKNDGEQNSLPAKELQKFLDKVKAVATIPRNGTNCFKKIAQLCLLVKEKTFADFKDYKINKTILTLLDDKYPLLYIDMQEGRKHVNLSIKDMDSGFGFKLPDQPLGKVLFTFLEQTKCNDKILLMVGVLKDGKMLFDEDPRNNIVLILDGYFIEP